MAPGSLSPVYLPDLAKCFVGDIILASWDDLLNALLSHDAQISSFAVETLSGDRPKRLLSQLFPTFAAPSPNSKTAFDTTTATIPPSDTLYNLEEIKSDALWLSKQANLDELEALRIAFLEWQYRPESRLKQGLSDAEVSSLRDALGSDYLDRQIRSQAGSSLRDEVAFSSQNARRSRILLRYLQQQVLAFRIRRELIDVSLLPGDVKASTSHVQPLAASMTQGSQPSSTGGLVEAYTAALQVQLGQLKSPRSWDVEEPDLSVVQDASQTSNLQIIAEMLALFLLEARASSTRVSTEDLLCWLRFMQSESFFNSFTSELLDQRLAIDNICGCASLLTATLFDLASSISALTTASVASTSLRHADASEYYLDPMSAWEVHELVNFEAACNNAQAGPAALCWALLLQQIRALAVEAKEHRENHHTQRIVEGVATFDAATGRRGSSGSSASFHQSIFEDVWDKIWNNHPAELNDQIDPADQLLNAAVSGCQVFEYISHLSRQIDAPSTVFSAYKLQTLQELVAVARTFLGYTPEPVAAQLALMSPRRDSLARPDLFDPSVEMLANNTLLEGFYDTAAARFPYETLPFLRFSRALAKTNIVQDGIHYVEFRLRNLTTFTQAAGRGVNFNTIREEENANWVVLNNDLNMLSLSASQQLALEYDIDHQRNEIIPAKTVGHVISDTFPPVVRWQHEFSGLAYIGKLVENHYMRVAAPAGQLESAEEVVSEALSVVATLLSSIRASPAMNSAAEAQEHCTRVLDDLGSRVNPRADFTSYVFEILEQELQSFRRRSISTFDCRVLISCLQFVVALTQLRPSQVWSNINRTSLFGRHSAAGLMLGLVSAVEIPQRSFDFLEQCTELYQALIQLASTRPPSENSSERRQAVNTPVSLSIKQRVQAPCILASTEQMFAVFQQIQNWAFDSRAQFARINTNLANCFSDIICAAFNFGGSEPSESEAGIAFLDASSFLISAFRPGSSDNTATKPIVRQLFAAGCGEERSTGLGYGDVSHIKSVLSLSLLLVRYGTLHDLPLSATEIQFFNTFPALIRILQLYSSCRPICLALIQTTTSFIDRCRPSSLLRHLGSESCIDFVHLIKHIDGTSQSSEAREEVWSLLSLMVKGAQQWLATLILTGAVPESSKNAKGVDQSYKTLRGKTFLRTAVDELGVIAALPQVVAVSMLEFVGQAQSHWNWVTDDLRSSADFFPKLISYVTEQKPGGDDEFRLALHNTIAAHVTDLSTTHLHYSQAAQNQATIRTYTPLLTWLASNAINVSSYKASLHANLRRNFATKYSGLSVSDFRRSGLLERQYGPNFFYDVEYAGKHLLHDSYWHGGQNRNSDESFAAEFRRANINLSLVDSELVLLLSLHRFSVDHCKLFSRERDDQPLLVLIVNNCFHANTRLYPAEAVFDTIFQSRTDLSLALLRQLLAADAKGSNMSALLEPTWNAVRARNGTYDEAIINNDLVYWRSMLSALVMVINYHGKRKPKSTVMPGTSASLIALDPSNTIFLEVATAIVAEGLKTVVYALQEQQLHSSNAAARADGLVGPRDVLLLLTMFQGILRLPILNQFSTELSERLSSSGIISSCLLLYSWSHLLRESGSDDQPDFAELSIQILVSLSSLPLVAEELAVEGVLNRILTSKTTEALQRLQGGVSHVDPRPNCGLLYRIWAGGILPLCLNLLHAVGGVMAAEISNFLNQFPQQLTKASSGFIRATQPGTKGIRVLTFMKASETSTLALISRILSTYREAGASAAVDPEAVSPLCGFDEHRNGIIDDLNDDLTLDSSVRKASTVVTNERELAWQKSSQGDLLDAKIVKELQLAIAALRREEDDEK